MNEQREKFRRCFMTRDLLIIKGFIKARNSTFTHYVLINNLGHIATNREYTYTSIYLLQ